MKKLIGMFLVVALILVGCSAPAATPTEQTTTSNVAVSDTSADTTASSEANSEESEKETSEASTEAESTTEEASTEISTIYDCCTGEPIIIVNFKDKNFEVAVKEALAIETEYVLPSDLEAIEELDIKSKFTEFQEQQAVEVVGSIESLDDLKYFTNLKVLRIEPFGTPWKLSVDLGELKQFPNLEVIDITGDLKGSTEGFEIFTNLTELTLCGDNFNMDFENIKNLTNLKELWIAGVDAINESITSDISALSGLTNLETLVILGTKAKGNIESVATLENLKSLSFVATEVEGNITSIQNLTNLEEIYLLQSKVVATEEDFNAFPNLQKKNFNKPLKTDE